MLFLNFGNGRENRSGHRQFTFGFVNEKNFLINYAKISIFRNPLDEKIGLYFYSVNDKKIWIVASKKTTFVDKVY